MMRSALVALIAAAILFPADGHALVDVPEMSDQHAGACCVAPFDLTQEAPDGSPRPRTSFLALTNRAASPSGFPATLVHWSYWSESCDHLVDVFSCLTRDQTYIADPSDVQATTFDFDRQEVVSLGTVADLTGYQGFVTVTAYATDDCRPVDPSVDHLELVDDALFGMWTIADLDSTASGGDAMTCFGAAYDKSSGGTYCDLPNARETAIRIQTFNPQTLGTSLAVGLVLQERKGQLGPESGEIGPAAGVARARAAFIDNREVRISFNDLVARHTLFTSLIPGAEEGQTSLPQLLSLDSSGQVVVYDPQITFDEGDGSPVPVGGDTWIVGWHLQSVGAFGVSSSALYETDADYRTPGPVPEPTPSVIVCQAGTHALCVPDFTDDGGLVCECVLDATPAPSPEPTPAPTTAPTPTPETTVAPEPTPGP